MTSPPARRKEGPPRRNPKSRPVRIVSDAEDGGGGGIAWSADGQSLAIQIRAIDNKDRWIATVDFDRAKLVSQHRLTDPAWINWNFNEFGWARDNRTLWYVSEESGYSQLYAKTAGGKAKALTRGTFEVSSPVESPDGRWFYLRANVEAPYSYDVYRVASGGGDLQRVTTLKGLQGFTLSPDGRQLALLHSSAYVPNQLAVASVDGGSPRDLTDTRTVQFKAQAWLMPEIVQVPSTHTNQPIHAKLYKPRDFDPVEEVSSRAVRARRGLSAERASRLSGLFPRADVPQPAGREGIRGARHGLPRERRLRPRLAHRDLSPDGYARTRGPHRRRALAGAERSRRSLRASASTAAPMAASWRLMAMFNAPEVFQAGAALRPVTDWTQYNHEYTSNILNTPQVDPIAYERSSPIEFAEGLERRPADRARHDRRQRAVRGFGAPVPAPGRTCARTTSNSQAIRSSATASCMRTPGSTSTSASSSCSRRT